MQIEVIEARGRYSRSGRTFFLREFRAVVRSNRYTYNYHCIYNPHEHGFVCSLTIPEKGIEDVVTNPPIIDNVMNYVKMGINLEDVNKTHNEVRIELTSRGREIAVIPGF